MTTRVAADVAAGGRTRPLTWRLGLLRGQLEIRQFFRDKDAVVFTFLLPVLLLVIFGSVFSGEVAPGVDFRQVFTAGMIAAGIMGSSFVTLAVQVAMERDDGTLKRLRGTPLPVVSYFIGKVVLVLVTSIAQVAILLAVGVAFYGLELPSDAGRWITFGWVFVLGITACSLLGLAMSSVPRSGRSAPAVVQPPFLVLEFISGVFFLFSELPEYLQKIASLFPLKWMTQGLRSVFLPDSFQATELAGSWEHGRTALVLVVWCTAGLVLSLRAFSWKARGEG